ncbi:major histocompatibility complex class I-related gene protein-like [Chanos chanos]|uniref:Major histocompatibility complex class I-related gene protein-like n=1 Tax=Chanos chanos TaxID=29144 RepID=A0A6J2W7X7_CHACN|nr:major histocompatibility complex class I-related gene protein-like [Chanos chanos]
MRSFLLMLFFGIHLASAGIHSLKYYFTATSEVPNFPEFVAVGMVDDIPIVYYDSNSPQATPKQDWMHRVTRKHPQYWEKETGSFSGAQEAFITNIDTAKQRFNQTGGVHTAQKMFGCEWDDGTGEVKGFNQHRYDGEDFISLDLENKVWVAVVPQALLTKQKWDVNTDGLDSEKQYLQQICIDWLKRYMCYGRGTLDRKISPEVSLLQKDPSSPVVCHATGFYPRQVMMSWLKNGEDLNEDVELGETLPNEDGTFQKSIRLTVSAEELSQHQYSCVVDHMSLQDKTVKTWGENEFMDKQRDPDNISIIIITVAAALLILISVSVLFFIWKRSMSGYGKTNNTDSDKSEWPAQKA